MSRMPSVALFAPFCWQLLLAWLAPCPLRAQEPAPETVVLQGRVTDLRGEGLPVAMVEVFDTQHPGERIARGMTDGSGYFRVGKVPKCSMWRVVAKTPGRARGEDLTSSPDTALRIRLPDAVTLRGVLRDREQKPVAGAIVHCVDDCRDLAIANLDVTTDAEGAFVLTDVPIAPLIVNAVVPGEGLYQHELVASADAEIELRAVGGPTTSLEIRLTGTPCPGAKLALLPSGSMSRLPPPWLYPVLGGEGPVVLHDLPDDDYELRPSAPGLVFAPSSAKVTKGSGPHVVSFAVSPVGSADLVCHASVRGPDDEPIAGVRFALRRASEGRKSEGTSDADGELTINSHQPSGTKVIVYALDDRWVVDQPKQPGVDRRDLVEFDWIVDPAEPITLRLVEACAVSGRIVRADGSAAAFALVMLEQEEPGRMPLWMTFARAVTDRDGRFAIRRRHHLDDALRITVEGESGSGSSEPFQLAKAGTNVILPDLKLAAPAAIAGVVRDANGQPAPGIRVWLLDYDMQTRQQRSGNITEAVTDREGRYRFLGVPVGGACVMLVAESGLPSFASPAPFTVEDGAELTRDLTLPAK